MRQFTAMEVAESARGPDSLDRELLDNALHHSVLLRSLHRDEVHAHLSADVPRIQPAGSIRAKVRLAREEVVVSRPFVIIVLRSVCTFLWSWFG